MKTWIKYLLALGLLLLAATLFYFKVYVSKTSYQSLSPKKRTLEVKVFGIGSVDAKTIYPVSSQIGGKITSILTDEGQWVKKGALLATVDSVDLPLLLEEAKVSLKKSRQDALAVKKELQNLQAQKELIYLTYKRYEKLYKQKYVAQSEYDKAKADLQSIDAQIAVSEAHIDSSKLETQRVQKSIQGLQTKLSRFNIYAPVDGFIISKDAEVAQSVLPAQSILRLVDPQTLWVKAYVDERISADIALNQNVDITLRSQENKTFKGHVARVSAISDPVTQEREVAVSFDTIPVPFYINEQAQVSITTKTVPELYTFDIALLAHEKGKVGVWTVENDKAHFLELKQLIRSDKLAGVPSQLDEDTKILVPSPKKKSFTEGMRVHL